MSAAINSIALTIDVQIRHDDLLNECAELEVFSDLQQHVIFAAQRQTHHEHCCLARSPPALRATLLCLCCRIDHAAEGLHQLAQTSGAQLCITRRHDLAHNDRSGGAQSESVGPLILL